VGIGRRDGVGSKGGVVWFGVLWSLVGTGPLGEGLGWGGCLGGAVSMRFVLSREFAVAAVARIVRLIWVCRGFGCGRYAWGVLFARGLVLR